MKYLLQLREKSLELLAAFNALADENGVRYSLADRWNIRSNRFRPDVFLLNIAVTRQDWDTMVAVCANTRYSIIDSSDERTSFEADYSVFTDNQIEVAYHEPRYPGVVQENKFGIRLFVLDKVDKNIDEAFASLEKQWRSFTRIAYWSRRGDRNWKALICRLISAKKKRRKYESNAKYLRGCRQDSSYYFLKSRHRKATLTKDDVIACKFEGIDSWVYKEWADSEGLRMPLLSHPTKTIVFSGHSKSDESSVIFPGTTSTAPGCLQKYNMTQSLAKRQKLLPLMFGSVGAGCDLVPPLHLSSGGSNCSFGNYVYANTNLTLLNNGPIDIGDNVSIGPNVIICNAFHPICKELRLNSPVLSTKIHICEGCWIGAGAIILPGVTIGKNSVIGAGAIVTKDIPEGVVAAGNPCKVIRQITDEDSRTIHGELIPDFVFGIYEA